MAKEAGYAATYSFDNLDDVIENLEEILHQSGPVFIAVKVIPMIENEPIGRRKRMPVPTRAASVQALREELGIADSSLHVEDRCVTPVPNTCKDVVINDSILEI